MKPTGKELEVLKGIKSEIVAGGILNVKSSQDESYNMAIMRAGRILDRYIEGKGLFQIDTGGESGQVSNNE
jgi:hypothetical protein